MFMRSSASEAASAIRGFRPMIVSSRYFTFVAVLAAFTCAPAVCAQEYPAKSVRVIVPFAPGGTSDFVARVYASALSKEMGQQFVIDNRGGAGGTIGADLAAKAAPDGYS